ncbi:MAG: SDR family oxidoreductase, partial [Myxococcota bacterium]
IETEALSGFLRNEAIRKGLEDKTPMRSVGTVEDAAAGALYLCSPAGDWMTGKILEIDGGITASNSPFELPDL